MYKFECVCGEQLSSDSVTGTCPHCKRLFELHWPVGSDKPPMQNLSAPHAYFRARRAACA